MTFPWSHLAVAVLCLAVLRLLPILLNPRYLPGDLRAMRLFIRLEREHSGSLWHHGYNHPVLFPWIVAHSGIRFEVLHVIVPFVADFLALLMLAVVLQDLVAQGLIGEGGVLLALYLFVFYPVHAILYIGPRSYGLSERVTMEAIFGIAVMLLLAPFFSGLIPKLMAGVLLFYLILASRFALQVIVLVLLPTLLTLGAWTALAILIIAFLAALAMPVVAFRERLRHHWRHLMHFRRYVGDPRYLVGNRNMPPRCRGMSRTRCLRRWLKFLTRTNAYAAGLVWHLPIIAAVALYWLDTAAPEELRPLAVLASWGVFAWLLTGFGIFKIAGIAERYLSFVILPALVVLATLAGPQWRIWLLVYVPLGIVMWLVNLVEMRKIVRRQLRNEEQVAALMKRIESLPREAKIAGALPTPYLWLLLERLWDRFSWHDIFFNGEWDKKTILHRYPKCDYLLENGYEYLVSMPDILEELQEHDPCYRRILKACQETPPFVICRVERSETLQ